MDVPGATPSHLVVALGKDRNMYLVNRDNLGGISAPIAVSVVASSTILQAAVTYRTKQEHLCRVPREQRWQHGPLGFSHHPNRSTYHRQRLECEPGRRRLRFSFCHFY